MFKNKMNAYGFMLIVLLWVIFIILNFFPIPNIERIVQVLFAVVALCFYLIAKDGDKTFALVGLILGLGAAVPIELFGTNVLVIAFLAYGLSFMMHKSKVVNIMGWLCILVFIMKALFGLWNVATLESVFVGIAMILVGLIFVYYLATQAGIDLPGGFDEKVRETIG
ncbi:MAG TPA: hypothetical protein PKV16_01935 [Caldisericia bacterium]|nr:hypothetical protein [Caldisericia bacterium]HPF48836.1 hypothetical protein [Caldisericia bacterium]HPI83300.1 hypothetical protein [Caldisericia bacterium]HPQ92527.1 hypothetical protein [Caldisericia bacterium]HRV74375.1 hypothetical protein [Caldisericia bacterium]